MKTTFIFTLLFLCMLLSSVHAAILTVPPPKTATFSDSTVYKAISRLSPKAVEEAMGKKLHWYQKLELKIIQKKLRKAAINDEHPVSKSAKVLSVISLIAGALAWIVLLVGFGWGVFIFTLASIITGIIAVSTNKNKGNKYRTMAIIGIVLGGVMVALAVIFILLWAAFLDSLGG